MRARLILWAQIWTASSARDIDTAQAFIKGAFPDHQAGKEGNGDGVNVQLIKVPNKKKDWEQSLTPHVCPLVLRCRMTEERLTCFGVESVRYV